jgi:flagellin
MAVRNANDGISMVQTADGALVEVANMLQRMRELAVQAASDTNTATDRDSLDLEFEALTDEIDRIGETTQFNGTLLLDGSLGAITFQVGANASQTIGVTFGSVDTDTGEGTALGLMNALDTVGLGNGTDDTNKDLDFSDLQDKTNASLAITRVDNAITQLNEHRATLGATINRLEYAADNLANVSQNASASRSRILDADYAAETTELARTQIIQQAGTAMLSQANQQAQSVLALLK